MHEVLKKAVGKYRRDITLISGLLADRGWAEASGGNLSLRLEEDLVPQGEARPLGVPHPELDGRSILFTVTASRMRDVKDNPGDNLCLVRIVSGGKAYVMESAGGSVTSEFPSHLAVHSVLVRTRSDYSAFLHSHPPHLIALSHIIKDIKELPSLLASMFPEAALLLADNLDALPYLPPGSEELAKATARAAGRFSGLIWKGHGMVAVGKNLAQAFDLIEVAEKAARVALLIGEKRWGTALSQEEVKRICGIPSRQQP